MSQENVAAVRAAQPSGVDLVAATSAGSIVFAEEPGALFSEDFASTFTAPDATAGPFRGFEGLLAGWRDWLEPWARYEIQADEFIDAGDRVVAYVRIRGTTRRDGVEVEHAPAAVWTLRDGKVIAIDFYLHRPEALKAVGLEK